MIEMLPWVFTGLALLAAVLSALAWLDARASAEAYREILTRLTGLETGEDRAEKAIREEMKNLRDESESRNRNLRVELGQAIVGSGESLQNRVGDLGRGLEERFAKFDISQIASSAALKHDLTEGLKLASETVRASTEVFGISQRERLDEVKTSIVDLTTRLENQQQGFGDRLSSALLEVTQKLQNLLDANEKRQDQIRETLTGSLDTLRTENAAKLEEMRQTVDEKLQGTLEKRLSESFLIVSERLDKVHQGLGEMQTLATGVGDLKRVLTNVKSRGGWAEVQLGALLENMLAPDQYVKNARIKPNSQEVVEYAIRMPGQGENAHVLLPIDAKFPHEDYERLMKAHDTGLAIEIEAAAAQLASVIRNEAKRIRDKYIDPPASTDFAIMYLPTEGLFAEAIRRGSLMTELQQTYRVTIAGPTTLSAFLNSLQMGFKTLAIQKRSSEVWQVLSEAKSEFDKYGAVWEKLSKQLDTVKNTVDEAGRRTRALSRKLKGVEEPDNIQLAPSALQLVDTDDDAEPEAKIA